MMLSAPDRFAGATNTGVDAIMHWRTPQGIYRNDASPDKTVSVDLEAETDLNPTGQAGILKVELDVYVNGDLDETWVLTSREWRQPNYAVHPARQAWAANPGVPAGFFGWGKTLNLAGMDGGVITVHARAYSRGGKTTTLGEILTIYNDTDGTDRRPSKKVSYVASWGNDANPGTQVSPFRTLHKAIQSSRANTVGTNLASTDCGGAHIYTLDGTVSCGGSYGGVAWHTSGEWKLRIEAIGTDRTYRRFAAPGTTFTVPNDYVLGAGGAGGSTGAAIEFINFEVIGPGITVENGGGANIRLTDVGCTSHSHYAGLPGDIPSVQFYFDRGQPFNIDGTGKKYGWGHYNYSSTFGLTNYTGLYDFRIEKWLGVGLQANSSAGPSPCFTVGSMSGLRYKSGEVAGLVDITGGTGFVVSAGPSAGQMRLDSVDPSLPDFVAPLNALGFVSFWGVLVSGFTSPGNNTLWRVIGLGYNAGGLPYVILDDPVAVGTIVPEVGTINARIRTARRSDLMPYTDIIHPDILQIENTLDGAMFAHVRAFDTRNTRSWVGAGYNLTRTVFKNLTDGSPLTGSDTNAFDFTGSDLVDCLFLNLTVASDVAMFDPVGTFTRTNFIDCVFGNGSANFPVTGTYIRNCHFIAGTARGIGPTTGAWFRTDPTVDPWSFDPLEANKGTGSDLVHVGSSQFL